MVYDSILQLVIYYNIVHKEVILQRYQQFNVKTVLELLLNEKIATVSQYQLFKCGEVSSVVY